MVNLGLAMTWSDVLSLKVTWIRATSSCRWFSSLLATKFTYLIISATRATFLDSCFRSREKNVVLVLTFLFSEKKCILLVLTFSFPEKSDSHSHEQKCRPMHSSAVRHESDVMIFSFRVGWKCSTFFCLSAEVSEFLGRFPQRFLIFGNFPDRKREKHW
jgi:hypothetical protein